MASDPRVVPAPPDGLWRIGRGEPLQPPARRSIDLGDTKAGNRFDSLTGQYSVLYFGTTLEVCFGETLNRYRRDPRLAFIEDDWQKSQFMALGAVPADWRANRTAVRVILPSDVRFLDVEAPETLRLLRRELRAVLMMFGHSDLDVAVLRGPDRRVTRAISEWAWHQVDSDDQPLFAGVRYLSRSSTRWECWAVFDDIELEELERLPILHTTPGLAAVRDLFDLQVF